MNSSTTNSSPVNSIRPFGYSTGDCGYCKGERAPQLPGNVSPNDSSKSWGMLADSMTPEVYEQFIAKGWRRSGIHIYKPCNFESCCPTLTIRLLTDQFRMTKSQSKVLRRMQNLIQPPTTYRSTGKQKNKIKKSYEEQVVSTSGVLTELVKSTQNALLQCLPKINPHISDSDKRWEVTYKVRKQSKQERKQKTIQVVSSICAQVAGKLNMERQALVQAVVQTMVLPVSRNGKSFGNVLSIVKSTSHEPSGQIIVTLQLLEKSSLMSNDDDDDDEVNNDDLTMENVETDDKLADWYQETLKKPLLSSERRISIQTMSAYESALNPQVFKLYSHYQQVVHDDPDPFSLDQLDKNGDDDADDDEAPLSLSEMDWGNAPKYFVDRVTPMLQQLCQEYNDELEQSILSNFYSFYQFLVEAPFPVDDDTPMESPNCGNYHQHYKIGDYLIAVGVVDILPSGLSSVYLFYDPSFSHQLVALGKYAILKEVEYTQQFLQKPCYYLGYYIESCQKMRYKAEYKPSELLCPVYYKWVAAGTALEKLKQTPRHVCALVDTTTANDEAVKEQESEKRNISQIMNQIQMDIGAGLNVTYGMLQESGQQVVKPILEEFIKEAGSKLCLTCLVKLS